MTKERKLAIQMWQNIRRYIKRGGLRRCNSVRDCKYDFCEEKKLHWENDCWFCNYIGHCEHCPLKSCSSGSTYATAAWGIEDIVQRLEACDEIIAALKGEYKHERWLYRRSR